MTTENSNPYILIAEDNLADIFLVKEALRQATFECEIRVITDGDEVIHFIDQLDADDSSNCPEAILLDLHLPKRDGAQILQHLQSSRRCNHTPVIIMTSSDSPRDQSDAKKYHAVHYFRKPSSLQQFLEVGPIVKTIMIRKAKADCHPDTMNAGT